MALPTIFTQTGGGPVATYDYYDLAEGTGIVKLYGYAIDTGTGTKAFALTTDSALHSAAGTSPISDVQYYGKYYTKPGASSSGNFELNFDLVFNRPQTIKGNVKLNVQGAIECVNPGSTLYIKAKLYKVDVAAAETAISSQITSETIIGGLATEPFFGLQIPLTAKTHFKAGESLRVEIIVYYAHSLNSNGVHIYHSPSDRLAAGNLVTSQLIVLVPFVIDL